jgi:F-box/leucine-rich repeat protein 2/20
LLCIFAILLIKPRNHIFAILQLLPRLSSIMANKEKEAPPLPPLLALLLAPSEEGVPGFRRSSVFNFMGLRERGAAANTCRGLSELVQHCRCGARSSSSSSSSPSPSTVTDDGASSSNNNSSNNNGSNSLLDVWSSLDFTGCRDAAATVRAALRRPTVAGSVKHLSFEFCKEIEDEDLAVLEGLALASLNLNALHKVSGDGVVAAARGSSATLRGLSLYWHHALPNAAVVDVAKACARLETLNLSGCQRLEDGGVRALARHCRGLTDLNLTRCPLLSGAALHFLGPRLTSLRRLNLYANAQIAPDSAAAAAAAKQQQQQQQQQQQPSSGSGSAAGGDTVAETSGYAALAQLTQLEFLDMCGASKAPPGDIATIAAGCRRLQQWNLSWCIRLNDEAVTAIAQHCRRLEWLSLFGIVNITDVSVDELAKPGRCGRVLLAVDVHGCCNIKRQKFDDLKELFPKLNCFTLHS